MSPLPYVQRSDTTLVLIAFGCHAPQSGSSFTDASMPTSRRLRVMICSEATQSDQPPMTWIWKDTRSPFGSKRLLPLYVKPAAVNAFFAASGSKAAIAFARALSAGSIQVGYMYSIPSALVGGA